jgi:hypothetical protein
MSFQFYKSKVLLNETSGTIPPQAVYVKSNVTNVVDGGEILRCGYNANYAGRLIQFTSGSITSTPLISQQIAQFVSAVSSSDNPYIEIEESEFVNYYSSSIAFLNNIG